jgi:recombination protein RecT
MKKTETKAVAKPADKSLEMKDWLESDNVKRQFARVLPQWMNADRFLRVAWTSMMRNPKLRECTPQSTLGALIQAAQLGLEPVLGRAHLIPYKNNKTNTLEMQFQVGYQGLIELAERTEKFDGISAHCVYEKDEFEILLGTEEKLVHRRPKTGDRGKLIGAYTTWRRKDGSVSFDYLSIEEIHRKFRARSQAYNNAEKYKSYDSPWHFDEDEMLKKSMIKHHAKMEPASIDFMRAVEMDTMGDIGISPQLEDLLPPGEAPENVTPERTAEDIDREFNEKAEGMDFIALEAFIKDTAAAQSVTEAEVKADALKEWRGFCVYFEKWFKSKSGKSDESLEDALGKV